MRDDTPQPNQTPKPKRRFGWLAVPLMAGALAMGVAYTARLTLVSHLPQQAALKPQASAIPAPSAEQMSAAMLTDSILSIVQSYYVDAGRVENRGLLETALAALASNPRIHTGTSQGAVWVQVDDGDKQFFPVKEHPRYQDVVDIFGAVARLLDESEVNLVSGEMPEKHAPGAVALLNAMLSELDAHSALLSPDAYRELRQGTEGTFGGLGVLVGIRDNLLTVIKPLPHSPAQRAGIRKHDRILSIGGVFTYGFSLDDLVEYMRGEPGTDVQLSVLRDGAHAPQDLSLKREVIHVDSVVSEDVSHKGLKVLHLTLDSFASRTAREVLSAIKRFKAKNGGSMHGLVLDLRSNPGGLLDQAVQVADLFLESGVIVTTKGRREEVETAGSGFDEVGFPMVVLIDGDSASASEIVAGALQDHQRAVIVGQPSFGKGSVQTVFELPGDRALKLTIARYYTPAGRSIQNVGIIPDVWLQPMAKSEENDNLFGSYRYKNERFLKNHLENAEAAAATVPKTRQAARKAYYLASPSTEASGDDVVRHPDREMDFALKIIEKVHATYGDHLPPGTDRASHWVGLAGPSLSEASSALDREAAAWLASKHKVNWTAAQTPLANPNVDLVLSPTNPHEITSGETFNIAWSITNHEAVAVSRASVFVRSEMAGFDTKEVLIGDLPAASTRSGIIQVFVPANFEPGPLQLRVGVAADAWPVRHAAADYLLEVNERPTAHLSATASLVDETGGHVVGTLESREAARIRVDLSNDGDVDADDVDVKLINLAGAQVMITHDSAQLETLGTGEEKHLYFDVRGAKTLVSPELAFGLYVQSPDLKAPFRQRFTVKGQPAAELSAKPVRVMSH